MYPRIRLGEASVAIEDQECQRVIRIVAMLNQEHSTQGALHGNQVTRWLALMMLQPTCPAAAEVTQPIKNNYSAFHFSSLPERAVAVRRLGQLVDGRIRRDRQTLDARPVGLLSNPVVSRRSVRLPRRRRPRIQLISMRLGFLRALDKQNARALLNAVEDDFGAVRRNVEIADHEACCQIGQLALRSALRIQLPEILAVDPAAKKNQRSGIARERNPSRAICQDQTWHVVGSTIGSRSSQRKYSRHLGT